jgi:hypothetical protein
MFTKDAVDRAGALHAARQRSRHAHRLIAASKNVVRRSQGNLLVALVLIEQMRRGERKDFGLEGQKPA